MKTKHIHGMSEEEKYEAYKIFFGTLVSEPRLKILNLLRESSSLSVSQICDELDMEQTSVSHNLSRMTKCGFVNKEKKGKYRYYSVDQKRIQKILDLVDNHMKNYCVHIHRGLR